MKRNHYLFSSSFSRLYKILSWILAIIKPPIPVNMVTVKPLTRKLLTIYQTRGAKGLILWCKNHRLALLHFLSGESINKRVEGVRLTKDGYPKSIGIPKDIILDNTTLLRLVLTILYSTRSLSEGNSPNTDPITSPSSVMSTPYLGKYKEDFWRDLGYRSLNKLPSRLRFKSYHMSNKSGPNGQALFTSIVDLKLIATSFPGLLSAILVLGGEKLTNNVTLLVKWFSYLPKFLFPLEGTFIRRLAWFPDKEEKVRVIAILDYWSQTALRSLHFYLFRALSKIPQDCTFSQGKPFETSLITWDWFDSVDLSSATDRFPISVIGDLFEGHFPDDYVKSWLEVMIGYPFNFQRREISYAVGNPMGAYSSWSSFTLAHHYIMYWCCRELGIEWRTSKYFILGDDVLIGDRSLAVKYKEVIASLGVEISPIKSHSSQKLFEFAKRLYFNGIEVSPFPISSIEEVGSRIYSLVNLLSNEIKKGWGIIDVPSSVSEYYRVVRGISARNCVSILEKASLILETMLMVSGGKLAYDGVKTIARLLNLPIDLSAEQARIFLSGCVKSLFDSREPFNFKKGLVLGQLAQDLVLEISALWDTDVEAASSLPPCIPILHVYGQIEEKYMEIKRESDLLNTNFDTEWPLYLNTLGLPVSDKVFTESPSRTRMRSGAVLSQVIRERLISLSSTLHVEPAVLRPRKP